MIKIYVEEDDEDAGRDERIECLCNMYDDVGVMLMCDACKVPTRTFNSVLFYYFYYFFAIVIIFVVIRS